MNKKILISYFFLLILASSIFSDTVSAAGKFDSIYFNKNDILYYEAGDDCKPSSGGTANLQGNDNVEKVWNFLKGKGLSNEQVAGIIGGMWGETGGTFDPGTVETGNNIGYGIAQWSFGRRTALEDYAREKGKPSNDLGLQLDFLWKELEDRGELSQIKGANDIRTVADIWVNQFERPREDLRAGRIAEGVEIGNELIKKYGSSGGGNHNAYLRNNNITINLASHYISKKNTIKLANSESSGITFIGDSITKGAQSELESAFSGSNVSAENGYSVRQAIGILPSTINNTVVINLGANDNLSDEGAIKELLSKIGKDKKIYWVNSYSKNSNADYELINSRLSKIAGENNISVLDWKSYVDSHGGKDKLYQSDGVHPNSEGYKAYLDFLKEKINGGGSGGNSNNSNGCGNGKNGSWAQNSEATGQAADGFSIFMQTDPRWAEEVYAPQYDYKMGPAGCGPTSLTMILNALGVKVDPLTVAKKANELGGVTEGGALGTQAQLIAKEYGLQSQVISHNSVADINSHLDQGHLIWLGGRGPYPFTSGGHILVVRKKTASGKWLIANPYSEDGTLAGTQPDKEWDPDQIVAMANMGTAVWK